MDASRVRKMFSVVEQKLVLELRGVRCYGLEDDQPKKMIETSRAFGHVIREKAQLHEAVATYMARSGEKLRKQSSYVQTVQVYVENCNRFRNDLPHFSAATIGLPRPTNLTSELITAGKIGVDRLFQKEPGYRKAGVLMLDVSSTTATQREFFAPLVSEKSESLMRALDAVNRKHGARTLYYAAQGVDPEWKMRREKKSPCYTTRLSELLVAIA